MSPNSPFREPASALEPRRAPPDALVFESPGAEQRLLPLRLTLSAACVVVLVAASATRAPVFALAVLVFALASMAAQVRRARKVPLVRLRVEGASLWIDGTAAPPTRVPLDTLREVEIEAKEVHREREEVGPTIPTTVSEYGGVSRVVFVSDGGARALLTPTYAPYSECMERFGKARVFLRAHGWRPVGERA